MNARAVSLAFGLIVALAGCRSGDGVSPAGSAPAPIRPPAVEEARRFGASLAPAEALPLGRVLGAPDQYAGRTVTVDATVRRNCTKKGCWMEIAEGADPAEPGCRVTFKDYGFFVPLDSAGARARVQGTLEVRYVSAGEVSHLEAEGARFAGKQPDGTAREVRLVATGVELRRPRS